MSRGPGRLEIAIAKAFGSCPSGTFTIEELVPVCYPGLNRPEKKHRVAILRAADRVASRMYWQRKCAERPGHPVIYRNLLDVRSYTLGKLRCDMVWGGRSLTVIEQMVDDPEAYRSEWADMQPGGAWWRHVEINRAVHEGREADAVAAQADLERFAEEKFAAGGYR